MYVDFFEKLRKLDANGFGGYSSYIKNWIEERITRKFYDVTEEKGLKVKDAVLKGRIIDKKLKQNISLSDEDKEVLSFVCYVAVCHIKHGTSYETVTANEYFNMVTELGSDEVEKLKKDGTGKLSKELTYYEDKDLVCEANDVFATIKIKVTNEGEEAYSKALDFINRLLKTDFPKSYEISFLWKTKELLPIAGLPKCGQHYLFAATVKFPNLHKQMLDYISLAKNKYQWYSNLEDEDCAMPSTFAVFALGLEGEKYFDVLTDYLQVVDEEHQSIQEKFTPVFLDKFGVNDDTIKLYIRCILSMQSHSNLKSVIPHFANENALKLLLYNKENFAHYYFTQENLEEFEESGNDVQEMADYYWENVMYTIFGKKPEAMAKELSPTERELFEKLK